MADVRPALRLRQGRLLGRPLAKAVRWLPMTGAAAAGMVVLGASVLDGTRPDVVVDRLRLTGLAVAALAAMVLDDPAAETLGASPTSLAARRGYRVVGAVAVAAVAWSALAAVAAARVPFLGEVIARLTAEAALYLAIALAGAALVHRVARGVDAGTGGAGIAFVVWMVGRALPDPWWPLPAHPSAPGAARAYALAALVAVAVLALCSLDPARRAAPQSFRLAKPGSCPGP